MQGLRGWAADPLAQLRRIDSIDLALRLTLLNLLLRPIGPWAIRPALLGLAGAALLVPGWHRRAPLWFVLAALTAARAVVDWPLADNHAYLISYWCLAIAVSLTVSETRSCLALNGRLLIGLVFAFASLWKIALSPDFLDGTFMRVTMLQDPRFEGWTLLVTDLSAEELADQRASLDRHLDAPPFEVAPGPPLPPRFVLVAAATTIWTALVEFALAVAFLWWRGGWLERMRHALLCSFCATTYAVATVDGFGWLLIAMGVAQCSSAQRRTRAAYLLTFCLILAYREVPWEEVLLGWLGG